MTNAKKAVIALNNIIDDQKLILTAYGKQIEFNASKLSNETLVSDRIGTNSVHGMVFKIKHGVNHSKFVAKSILLSNTPETTLLNRSEKLAFMREVTVGGNIGINKVGVPIVAFYIGKNACVCVMEHFTKGHLYMKHCTLNEFLGRKNISQTSLLKIINLLKTTLLKFYNITKGYHADLHFNNIAVVYKNISDPLRLIIYDFGSHTPFRKNVTLPFKTLYDAFSHIQNDFGNRLIDSKFQVQKNDKSGLLTLHGPGQPIRSNIQLLSILLSPTALKMLITNSPNSVLSKRKHQFKTPPSSGSGT